MEKNKKQLFRVTFDIKQSYKGHCHYSEGSIDILAENDKDAIRMVKDGTVFEMINLKAGEIYHFI